jgi:hypothetical protein
MHIKSLTRREVWLAVFVLVSLLFLSKSHANLDHTPFIRTPHDHRPPTYNSSYVEHERERELLHDRIRWGANDVPQTKIVAHVPGESYLVFSSNAIPN